MLVVLTHLCHIVKLYSETTCSSHNKVEYFHVHGAALCVIECKHKKY